MQPGKSQNHANRPCLNISNHINEKKLSLTLIPSFW